MELTAPPGDKSHHITLTSNNGAIAAIRPQLPTMQLKAQQAKLNKSNMLLSIPLVSQSSHAHNTSTAAAAAAPPAGYS